MASSKRNTAGAKPPDPFMKNTNIPDSERTKCEIWTRVMGYHRPVSQFNAGKQSEHRERKFYREETTVITRGSQRA